MKFLLSALVAIIMVTHFDSSAQTNDLNAFLVRFKAFSTAHAPKIKSLMPFVNPGNNSSKMPNAIDPSKAFMEDMETGLRIFPQSGKLFDPKTGYSLDYDPSVNYHVDLKAGKIYQDQSEVKVEQQQKRD